MESPPRSTTAHIVTKAMGWRIISVGIGFVVVLFGLIQYFRYADITSLTQFNIVDFFAHYFCFGHGGSMSKYELSLFFTIFVCMQFWNMFNAKAFMTGRTALAHLRSSIAVVILVGQICITTIGGEMFNVVPLKALDWVIIITATSLVLWCREIMGAFRK